jgi:hypothetical protein
VSETPRPLPGFATWPTFPFEGDFRVKELDDPVSVEPARHGDDPSECRACQAPDEAYIWVSERWRVRSLERPTGLPMVLILESRSHLDLGDLPNMLAAELGVMTVRLERAIRSLDGVARVHVNRWGDGSAHLHLWFLARPYGQLQLRGTFLSLWDEILPPIQESSWRENLALVAAWLAEFGGRPLAEPPRIDWKAPATLSPAAPELASDEDEDDEEDLAGSGATEDLVEDERTGAEDDASSASVTWIEAASSDEKMAATADSSVAGDAEATSNGPAGEAAVAGGDGHDGDRHDRDGEPAGGKRETAAPDRGKSDGPTSDRDPAAASA